MEIKHIILLTVAILFISPLLFFALAGIVSLISETTSFHYSRSNEYIVVIIEFALSIIGSWLVLRGKRVDTLLLTIFSAVLSLINTIFFLFLEVNTQYIHNNLLELFGLSYTRSTGDHTEELTVFFGFVYPIIILFSITSTFLCYKIYKKYYRGRKR